MTEYIEHDYIRKNTIEKRSYQTNLAQHAMSKNCLVVLPTGLGKTAIALQVIAQYLSDSTGSILFLAPTRVLVNQHYEFLQNCLMYNDISLITGTDNVANRSELWGHGIICATPEVARNDLASGIIQPEQFSLVIFDEVHRTVGDYAYSSIAARLGNTQARILGMTATLPSETSKAADLVDKLDITAIAERTEDSPDVKAYTQQTHTNWVRVDLPPELLEIQTLLKKALDQRYGEMNDNGVDLRTQSLTALLRKRQEVLNKYRGSATALFTAIRIHYALSMLEAHGITPFLKFCKRTRAKKAPGISVLFNDPNFSKALRLGEEAQKNGIEHSKILKLHQLIDSVPGKVLIFTSYRDSVDMIRDSLKLLGITTGILIGKAGTTGLKQKAQVQAVQDFRDGKFRVMVCTRVGEEGLDIAEVNHVIFYDNVPSSVRHIQRRGRTGRKDDGNLTILVANNTIDETYYNIGQRKIKAAKSMGGTMTAMLADRKKHVNGTPRRLDSYF